MDMQQQVSVDTDDAVGITSAQTEENVQFLTFTIGDEEYGVDIMTVREVMGWTGTTRLPNTPEHIRGVINLRGVILPIFDLRARFGKGLTEATDKHVVIVMAVGARTVGILVDTVSDILTASADDIKPAPDSGGDVEQQFVSGLIAVRDRMVVALEMEKLFDKDLNIDLGTVEIESVATA